MEYRFLGSTGLRVSAVCLGAMTFGASAWGLPGQCSEELSYQLLDAFVAAGGNFIDTADVYSEGESEAIIGRWLASKPASMRERLVIATKMRNVVDATDVNASGLSRKYVTAAVQRSLRRLQVEYIDLLQVHGWDVSVEPEEVVRVLDALVRSGKVHHVGVSNWCAWQIQKANDYARAHGMEPFVCNQPQYHLLGRGIEWELLPMAVRENMATIVYSPLAGGWLTGKHKRDAGKVAEGTRAEWAGKLGVASATWASRDNPVTWAVLDRLHATAAATGHSVAQVALRWALQRAGVTCVIIGARTLEQLADNLGCVGWSLSDDHMAALNAASDVPPPPPYDSWSLHNRDMPMPSVAAATPAPAATSSSAAATSTTSTAS